MSAERHPATVGFGAPAEPALTLNAFAVRNFFFLVAVLLMNYTLSRPSPVDATFLFAFALSVFVAQRITVNFVLHLLIVTVWLTSLYMSSIHVADKPLVQFQYLALGFVVILSLSASYISSSWTAANFERFFTVYIVACCIAATLGVVGFALNIDVLLWDGRAKALLDDPNMFGGLLLPGIFACIYKLRHGRRPILAGGALLLLSLALVLSFSRIAVAAFLLFGALFVLFVNRDRPARAGASLLALLAIVLIVTLASFATIDNVAEKLADRFTLAKEYDLGHGGRYNRWLLSLSYILDYPMGMGLYEIDRYFPEPIHNMLLSSFLNYGWAAGIAWIILILTACRISYRNFKATQSDLPALLFVSFAALMSCAMFHQTERWRSLWLFIGLVYGFNARNVLARTASARPAPRPAPSPRTAAAPAG